MRKTIARVLIGLWIAGPGLAHAGAERAGTTAANFLSVGSGARIVGMGGASIGLGGGLDATSWNPGALGWLNETEIVLSHAGLSQETAQEWAAAGGRFGGSPARWSISGLYQTEGTFEGRTASNQSTGSFGISSMALGANVAYAVGRHAAVGLGTKWVSEDLEAVRGSGLTFDGGILVRAGMVGFGIAAQNVFGAMSFEGQDYPFPSNVGAGVALDHARTGLRADLDVNFPSAYYTNVRGGVEWQWRHHLALRGGYRAELGAPAEEALSGPSFGIGAGSHGIWFDYGYLLTGNDNGEHRVGLSFRPSRMNWSAGDPFGQKKMPRDFDDPSSIGRKDAPKTAPPGKPKDE